MLRKSGGTLIRKRELLLVVLFAWNIELSQSLALGIKIDPT
jgi:hypothetical protein